MRPWRIRRIRRGVVWGSHGLTISTGSPSEPVPMNHQALRHRVVGMQARTSDQVADSAQSSSASNTNENIFLFVPNLIGIIARLLCKDLILTREPRLHQNYSRHNLPLLHAPAPSPLQLHLHSLLPPGCPRWLLCSKTESTHEIWCCSRHGH